MNCTHCGVFLSEHTQFCPHCGNSLNDTSKSELHPLLKRALLFIQEGNVVKADDYCEQVLDQQPENAYAYVIQLMIRAQVKEENQLATLSRSFADWQSYKNALRFADETLRTKLESYLESTLEHIHMLEEKAQLEEQARLEEERERYKQDIYRSARQYDLGNASSDFLSKAISRYKKIPGYMDANERMESCKIRLAEALKIETDRKVEQYRKEQRSKRIKNILITSLLLVLLIVIPLTYYFVDQAHSQRAERIHTLLEGTSFTGSYTSTQGSKGSFTVPDYVVTNEVTYTFTYTGSVTMDTTKYYLKGVHQVINGVPQYEKVTHDSSVLDDYMVNVSFWGDVTVAFNGGIYELKVNSDDHPTALVIKGVTYS